MGFLRRVVAVVVMAAGCGGRFEPRTQADCLESKECRQRGACFHAYDREGVGHYCTPHSDAGCRDSEACRKRGECQVLLTGIMTTDSWMCSPREPRDCLESEGCAKEGLCHVEPQSPETIEQAKRLVLPLYEPRTCVGRP